jgi:hypothetical protein
MKIYTEKNYKTSFKIKIIVIIFNTTRTDKINKLKKREKLSNQTPTQS